MGIAQLIHPDPVLIPEETEDLSMLAANPNASTSDDEENAVTSRDIVLDIVTRDVVENLVGVHEQPPPATVAGETIVDSAIPSRTAQLPEVATMPPRQRHPPARHGDWIYPVNRNHYACIAHIPIPENLNHFKRLCHQINVISGVWRCKKKLTLSC